MKSSIATTSTPPVPSTFVPERPPLPVSMMTRAIFSPAVYETPTKLKPLLATGADAAPGSCTPAASINLIRVRPPPVAESTSAKTTPKPETTAGSLVPGTKNVTSMTVEPGAVKRRSDENGWKIDEYCALTSPKRTAVVVGLLESALTLKRFNALFVSSSTVLKTMPRGLFELKKFGGRKFGAAAVSGTPSQLISRRPEVKLPPTPLLTPPRSARNVSTMACSSAGFAPE